MDSNSFFIALGILDNYLEKTTSNKSTLPPGTYQTSLDTSPHSKLLSLHCKQINRVKNEVDGQTSGMSAYMKDSDYKAAFILIHLVFLDLETHHCNLDFMLLDKNYNAITPQLFHIQLLNKDCEYIQQQYK